MLKALLLALALPAASEPMSGGGYKIARHAAASGGEISTGGGLILTGVAGQGAQASAAGAGTAVRGGLSEMIAQPGSVVSLTAATKSTGTLTLNWSAPGLDGFAGSVAAGFYRVDYSSDPLHVFAPTTFVTEFATAVAPGDPQSLTLTGLEVNTTYYARVYLAGSSKFFSEDSYPGAESTLANIPESTAVVEVSSTHVRVTYLAPAGGAEGYQADFSTTAFAGGAVITTSTTDGGLLSLTAAGLTPNSTYFFRVGSYNWQSQTNYTVLFQVLTVASGSPEPILFLVQLPSPYARSVAFDWTNQPYANNQGVMVIRSTNAAVSVTDLQAYNPGDVLGDGSVVRATGTVASYVDGNLALNSTYYYHFFSQAAGPIYSVGVSTLTFLDLPPMAVSGLASQFNNDATQALLSWKSVRTNDDGSLFISTAAPIHQELSHFEIWRATSVFQPGYVRIATVPASTLDYADVLPVQGGLYLYKVVAVDSYGKHSPSMSVDSGGDMYIFAGDSITHLRVPRKLVPEVGVADVVLRAVDEAPNLQEKTFRSVRWEALRSEGGGVIPQWQFSQPEARVALRYEVVNGQIAANGESAAPGAAAVPSAGAAQSLGMYWHNGAKYVKLYGDVDTNQQLVNAPAGMMGSYQIRGLLRDQAFTFDPSTLSNRVITPNGDGRNDRAVFRFDNPRDSAFTGRIFDVTGAFVSEMAPGPDPNTLQWDGRGNGRVVPGGVYVYQIRSEGKVFNGTLVVVR